MALSPKAQLLARPGNRFDVSFASDIKRLQDGLRDRERKQIPFALAGALNDTAYDAFRAEQRKMQRAFDRPTRFTLKGVRYQKAKKTHLVARVYIADREDVLKGTAPARYLRPQVQGGPRKAKPFEARLRRAGVLGSGEFAVPARGVRLNRYGNIAGGKIEAMLSQLQAAEQFAGYQANETAGSRGRNLRAGKARYFFADGSGQLPRGIYERTGRRVRGFLMFVSGAPGYARRYAFPKAALKTARRVFGRHFSRRFRQALATARR